jgi:DNA-directed RNA polymerase specialized sigma subunit, sigma24 homolog
MQFDSSLSSEQFDKLVSLITWKFSVPYQEAEDILQEAILKFHCARKKGRLHPDENESNEDHTKIHPYLWKCISSSMIDVKRKKKRRKTRCLSDLGQEETPMFDPVDPTNNLQVEQENVFEQEDIAREELDRAKALLNPNRAGKNDNRYLVWHQVDMYFTIRRQYNDLSLPPRIVIYDDEKKWRFKEFWPDLIVLCDATYVAINLVGSKKDIIDIVINDKFHLGVSETTRNKWSQRMRDEIREKLPKMKFPFLWGLFNIQEKPSKELKP